MIVVVDFGGQTSHLIARRVRDLGVDVQLVRPEQALSEVKRQSPSGIILSGGPADVFEKEAPTIDAQIFQFGIPVLGICYGWQLMAHLLGGTVLSGQREYGPTQVMVKKETPLFAGITAKTFQVWMSHGNHIAKLPDGFEYCIASDHVEATGAFDATRKLYGILFHPEVEHTKHGLEILRNFIEKICSERVQEKKIDVETFITGVHEKVMADPSARAIAAVSGGVDSTVAAAIVAKAMGDRFIPVYCDNGLMRAGTRQEVEHIFRDLLHVQPVILECQKEFLAVLKGLTDPEEKRKAVGKLYIELFNDVAKKTKNVRYLVQGTIFSDVIESKGSAHASKIKSHHNVGGLPADMKLELLEPLRTLYKDEVRELGRQLGLPKEVFMKQPVPGPGHAIRIMGEVTPARLQQQQLADAIVIDVLQKTGWYDRVFQSFSVLTGAKSTAVKGDGRVYGEVVAVRILDTKDIMTADWTRLPYDVLQTIASRIVNEVSDISRVVYDITTKPPATMEWE